MKLNILSILLLSVVLIQKCNCATILAILPMPSFSHQIPFRPLWRELSLRGHKVTLLTTDPEKNPNLTNLTEVDISFAYDIFEKHNIYQAMANESISFTELGEFLQMVVKETATALLMGNEMQKLITHKENYHFDLYITEAQVLFYIPFSWIFKCPWIGVSSLDAALHFHDTLGNPSHPVINPDYNLKIEDLENLSFKDRFISFLFQSVYRFGVFNYYYPEVTQYLRAIFGEDLPELLDIQRNMSMAFISTHPFFNSVRPIGPNTITIGTGMHFKDPEPLAKDLQKYLDDAKQGVIYFSLGTNVKGNLLNDTTKRNILNAFAELPYKVLMKIDSELQNVPKNVKVEKWMPQQDVLRHPNIKVFITQGGLQSLQEAIVNGIPLVGIPFFGDQFTNVNKMVKKGYGVKLDKNHITKEYLKHALLEVIENPKYRQKAKEMGEIFLDQEMSSLDKAIWWTEYVIRHKGAKHLKSPVVGMPFWKYYMLDVIGFVAAVTLVVTFVLYKLLKYLAKKCFRLLVHTESGRYAFLVAALAIVLAYLYYS